MNRRVTSCFVPVIVCSLVPFAAAEEPLLRRVSEAGKTSAVVVAGHPLVHTAQILPLDADGNLVGERSFSRQLQQVMDNLSRALAASPAKTGMDKLVRLHVCLADGSHRNALESFLDERFSEEARPAVSLVVTKLPSGALVACDAVAAAEPHSEIKAVTRRRVNGLAGPAAIAHLSVLPAGRVVHVSGQAARADDLAQSARLTLEGLHRTLEHYGLDRSHVVRLKTFLKPMSDVDKVNRAVSAAYGDALAPPVVHVEWTNGAPIEIELVAFAPDGTLEPPAGSDSHQTVRYLTPPWMKSSPVFSRAAVVDRGSLIYTGSLVGRQPGSGEEQVRDIFAQLEAITGKTGSDLKHLVKATYYVSDADASAKLNAVRPEIYDPKRPPAASKASVAGVGDPKHGIAIDMIAVTKR